MRACMFGSEIFAIRLHTWYGVKYFTILGPNREKLEFNQYL